MSFRLRMLAAMAAGLLLTAPDSVVAAAASPEVQSASATAAVSAMSEASLVTAIRAPLTAWSGTLTYHGHQNYTPVETGGYSDHFALDESFTAQVSTHLNDLGPGDGAIGNLSGLADGTETFDHTATSPDTDQQGNDCVRHDDTTYSGSRGGNIDDLAMTARYDGTYELVTDLHISDLGRMASHSVSGCGKDGTTLEHFYTPFPGYQGTSGQQFVTDGTISSDGTTIRGSQNLTGERGWTATYTWDLHASCDSSAPQLRSSGVPAITEGRQHDDGGGFCLPTAIPGPVQTVRRGDTLTLDASRSLPGSVTAKIVRYDWEVIGTLACKVDVQWRTTTAAPTFGPFTALCDATVLLTVTNDRGGQDTGRSSIKVTPRGAPFTSTPFNDIVDDAGKDIQALPAADTTADTFYAGINVAGCSPRFDVDVIFCPQGPDHVYRDVAYRLRTVQDQVDGPFQGYAYVSSTSLTAAVRGITNVSLTATAPVPGTAKVNVYTYNMTHNKASYLAYLTAISQHENMGVAGRSRSGHGQLSQKGLQNGLPEDNIRVWVEHLIDKSDAKEQKRVEDAIILANKDINRVAADPLDLLGAPVVYLWNADADGVFHWQAQTCQIGDVSICRDIPDNGTATPDGGAPGSQIKVNAGPFTPGEPVKGDLHSSVLPIGTFTVGAHGQLDAAIGVPACATPGTHEIVLTGLSSGKTVTIPFTVVGTPETSCAAATRTVTSSAILPGTSATSTPATAGTGQPSTTIVNPSRALASTGTETDSQLVAAIAFLAFGASLLLVTRRRYSAHSSRRDR